MIDMKGMSYQDKVLTMAFELVRDNWLKQPQAHLPGASQSKDIANSAVIQVQELLKRVSLGEEK